MAPPRELPSLLVPRAVAMDALTRQSPAAASQQSAWPSGTGRAPAGMVGELPQGVGPVAAHAAGGQVQQNAVHPEYKIVDQLFSVLPEEGWFNPNVSPSSPVQFEVGSYAVAPGQHFWMMDYEFQVWVQSGIDAGDSQPATSGRFSAVMGFDLTFSGRRLATLRYELDPHPVATTKTSVEQTGITRFINADLAVRPSSDYNTAAYNQFAAATGAGLSLLPVTDRVMGARNQPFTLIAQEGDRVTLSCAIFHPVPAPITAISARVGGFQLGKAVSEAIIQRMRPR